MRSPADGGLGERIERAWAGLGPQEQRVAEFLRTRPDESAVVNSSELARLTGVSKATVSRLYRRLGFTGSQEARALLRAQRGAGVPVVLEREGDRLSAQLAQDVANLQRLAAELDRGSLETAARRVAEARRVLVVGLRTGLSVAVQLRQALAQARPDVVLAPQHGQSLGEELVGLTAEVPAALAASEAAVVLIAEPGAALEARVEHRFAVPIESTGPFDSYAAAAGLATALADAVLVALGDAGARRVAEIAAAYADLGELDPA